MNPELFIALTQMIRLGADSIDALNSGEKTDVEIMQDIEDMHERVRLASARWRSS